MRRWTGFVFAAGLALAVSACAGDRSPDVDTGEGAVGTSGTISADRDFIDDQLVMGQAEVELSRLAQERASHPDVKAFAEMIARDHDAAGNELKRIAKRAEETTRTDTPGDTGAYGASRDPARDPQTRDPQMPGTVGTSGREHDRHIEEREELAKLSGRDFDRKYMELMVDHHEKAVRELEDKADNAKSTEVRQWASNTLTKVREHLDRAKQIQNTLNTEPENAPGAQRY